jgi:hypothetical protein
MRTVPVLLYKEEGGCTESKEMALDVCMAYLNYAVPRHCANWWYHVQIIPADLLPQNKSQLLVPCQESKPGRTANLPRYPSEGKVVTLLN